VKWLLEPIYEALFVGFRGWVSAEALRRTTRSMRWGTAPLQDGQLGARRRHPAFFDTIDHGWMAVFVEHRIGDRPGLF
jgi:hypothetical protein